MDGLSREDKVIWLSRYRRAYERVFDIDYLLKDSELKAAKLSEVHSMQNSNQLDRVLIKRESLMQERERVINEIDIIKTEITRAIDAVPDKTVARILYLKYVNFMESKEIADTLHYSVRHIRRLHIEGINAIKL